MSDDTADTAPATPRQEHLAELLGVLADADKLLRQVIADELAEGLPKLEQDEADAAAALEKVFAAARDPERDLAAIDAEIAAAEADRAKWQAMLTDETPREERARARFQHAECESDIARLGEKRDFVTAQLLPLRDAVTKAKRDLEAATGRLRGAELNATPLLAYYAAGQKTSGYAMRFGIALEPALADESHPEHDAAVDHMLYLATVTGFRTESYADRLPSDAMAEQRFWDSVYANPPQPPPSGREIIEALHTEMNLSMVNKALGPSRIDDYRGPAPPKPVPDRPWMRVPRVSELGIR
jgi:hypothetical protein